MPSSPLNLPVSTGAQGGLYGVREGDVAAEFQCDACESVIPSVMPHVARRWAEEGCPDCPGNEQSFMSDSSMNSSMASSVDSSMHSSFNDSLNDSVASDTQ